jgi:signal peptidase I
MRTRQWILILLVATISALLIRMFVFETIKVASSSMSKTFLKGDILIVEKWSIGPRLPMSIGFPFFPDSILGRPTFLAISKQSTRIAPKSNIKRNDILAFNQPFPCPLFSRNPILLSRCVGLPGETLVLTDEEVIIDGKIIDRPTDASNCFGFPKQDYAIAKRLLKIMNVDNEIFQSKDSCYVYLTRLEWYKLSKQKERMNIRLEHRMPYNGFNIKIPKRGYQIPLNDSTLFLYGELIKTYENVEIKKETSNRFLKNNHKSNKYVFQKDYYFMLNDHQGYTNDSRSFGLIPEQLFIGKIGLLMLSPSSKRFMLSL